MLVDGSSDAKTKLMTGRVCRHFADISRDDLHGIASITHQQRVMAGGFGCRPVDNGDEITCDDESVLAFLFGVLRDQALLDDSHGYWVMGIGCWVLGDMYWCIVWR